MDEIRVDRLNEYSAKDAEQLGRLLTFLSDRFTGEPVNEAVLRSIIDSPYHDQLVARLDGRIVGAATMSVIMRVGDGPKGYLDEFVVDPIVRGQGIGSKVWGEVMNWCREQAVDLHFTSNRTREDAHSFYLAHGAHIRSTTVFTVRPERE